MKVYFSQSFIKQYKLLGKRSPKLAKKLEKRVNIFLKNPHHPILRTHRLSGKLKNKVRFLVLGKHDQVYK